MADRLFEDPRLASLYDPLDPDRSDLTAYRAIAREFGARSVLDIGCGTGTLACLLALDGYDVFALDPAAASLDIARAKPGAERVRWIQGDVSVLPALAVDLVVMTGNVAQVFVTDAEWETVLRRAADVLRAGGRLVFETRDPQRRAWREWRPELTLRSADVTGVGTVEAWEEVTEVAGPTVTFESYFRFLATGEVLVSTSTLRFRGREEIRVALERCGFTDIEIRDAPDRPGRELVFVATRAETPATK